MAEKDRILSAESAAEGYVALGVPRFIAGIDKRNTIVEDDFQNFPVGISSQLSLQ